MVATSHAAEIKNELFEIRNIPVSQPFIWLARGWDDLVHHKAASLAYGVLVSVMGAIILQYGAHPYFLAAAVSGFLLVGPILTAGLCELSRRRDRKEQTDFDSSLNAFRHNRKALNMFAGLLLLLSLLWFSLSAVILHYALGSVAPDISDTMWGDLLTYLSTSHLLAYFGVGGLLAVIVFCISVVSVPMILDSGASARRAITTSIRVSFRDFPAMLVWSFLIVILTIIGFATFLIGMVIVFPLLGHATWYAYRDLIH